MMGRRAVRLDDYRLLEDVIIAEDRGARLEDMDALQGHASQEISAKRPEIWAITETARRDSDQFTARRQLSGRECEESSIEITRLNTDLAQQSLLR
jgi:hypothetical protein